MLADVYDMYDLIIIGAGPGGIALAAEACASGISQSQILVLEKDATHNSAIRQLYPDQKLTTANYKGFSYADAHRARMGVNYKQIPVNRPKVPVHSYSKDGAMRVENVSDPVYAPNSKGGPKADPERFPYVEKW